MVRTPNYKIKAYPQSLIGSPLYLPARIGLENWSSKSSTASNPLHPTNKIDRIQSSQTTAPPWRSKINPVQKDHCCRGEERKKKEKSLFYRRPESFFSTATAFFAAFSFSFPFSFSNTPISPLPPCPAASSPPIPSPSPWLLTLASRFKTTSSHISSYINNWPY